MKKIASAFVVAACAALASSVFAADAAAPASGTVAPPAVPRPRLSPHETTGAVIDGNRVTIIYGRPYAKKPGTTEVRKVWGSLVPYGKVWRTGSDEATLLVTQRPIEMGGVTIPAGVHSLFSWPNEDGSLKLIVNKQVGQWGIPGRGQDMKDVYDEANDVVRVDAKKDAIEPGVDEFTIAVERNPAGGGVIKLAWENTQYSVLFTTKK
jgi:hypothetical protein